MAAGRKRARAAEPVVEQARQDGQQSGPQDGAGTSTEIETGGVNASTARREGMADIARRRAAHFAHFETEDAEAGDGPDNVHVGGDEASQLGPWSSARQLVEARAAAAQARKERLQDTKSGDEDLIVDWKPTRKNWQALPRAMTRADMPSLSRLCVRTVADHIDYVESLIGLPQIYLTQIAECVACRRKLTPEAWRIFTACGPSEVVVSNCTQVSEAAMVEGLQDACTYKLEKLDLHFCGRGFGEKAAAAVVAAGPLRALRWLRLSGAYRLQPACLLALLEATPGLQHLLLPHCMRLQGPELPTIAQRLPGLLQLNLSSCGGLDSAALAEAVGHLQQLQSLSLDEVAGVNEAVLAAAARPCLLTLHVRRCPAVTDASIAALASSCPNLKAIALSETPISEAALEQLALHCPQITDLDVRKCVRVKSEAALVAIAQVGLLQRLDVGLVKVVSGAVIMELAAACAKTLVALDISFCRNVQSEAVGHLLDACEVLTELRIFGCSHITRAVVYGHSNDRVLVEGEPTFGKEAGTAAVERGMGKGLELDTARADDTTVQAKVDLGNSDSDSCEVI